MKKIIKKLTAVLLSLSIILATFSLAAFNDISLLSVNANAVSEGEYEYFVEDGYAVISAASDTLSGDIVVPGTLGGYPVGGIDSYAFTECKNVTGITLPDSVMALNDYAFSGCTSLNRIDLGRGLEYIGNGVFELCTSLLAIRISDNENFYIDNGALCDDYSVICLPPKSGVRDFDVGNRIVRNLAFAYCEDLEYIYLGEEADLDDGEWVGTCPSLKAYVVNEANPNWSSDENGALYVKDKTWLISYPPKTDAEDIILPDTVKGMHILAFSGEYDAVLNISESLSDFFYQGKDILLLYSAFKGFEVSDYDMNFAVKNGVLYTADKKTLMKYPISNERSFFELPESTKAVYPNAFVSLDLSGNPTTEDYEQLFLRPEKLTVHTSVSFFTDYEEIGILTNGMMGVKKICIDIAEQTDDVEKTLESINNLVESYADSESSLDVSAEAKLSILFEVIQCEGPQMPEIVNPGTPVDPYEPQILYIEFERFPDKSDYVLFEPVNVDGAVLRVIYNNGVMKYVSEGFTFSPAKFNTLGNNYVTVNYKGAETGYETYVTLGPPRSITVNTANVKKEYIVGESFDDWGMSVTAKYADGSTETVYGGYEIQCDEFTKAGTYTVTVEYEGCQTSFDVTVGNMKPYFMYVLTYPKKLTYTVGETLDTTGLELEVIYPDYSSEIITDGFEVECDLSTAGTKTAVVSYTENGATVTAEFTVEVKVPVEPADILVSDVSVLSGETVSIPVNISNNSGFMGFSLILKYDETALTPVSVTAGDMLGNGSFVDSIGGTMPEGQLKVSYYADENISADGTLFYVNFAAAENTAGDYAVNVSYIQKDTFDENFENVIFNCESSTVSITIPDDGKVRFYSDSVSADAGGELLVPVYAATANGLTDFTLTLTFNDEILEFKGIHSGIVSEVIYNDSEKITVKGSNVSINSDELLLFYAAFDVAEYIEAQETMNISCDSAVVNNANAETVCTNAEISIINPYADDPAFIYTDEIVSVTGGYIDIPVYINNNHGIMGFGMNVSYDSSVLEPVSVNRGDVISGGSFDNNTGMKQGSFKVVWSNSADVTDNGLLFVLRFRVLDGQNMKRVPVEISYSQPDTFNEKWEDVALDIRIDKINTADDSPEVIMVSKRTITVDETIRLLPSCNFETTRKVWTSGNPDVATVDSHGKVTAVGEGKCTIKVTCYGVDSFGNEIKAEASAKIVVNEKSEAKTLKERFREAFDNFFEIKLYDFAENLKKFILSLFKIAY